MTPQYHKIGELAELANYFDVLFDPIESAGPNEFVISANEAGRAHFGDRFTWYEHGPHKEWRNAYVTSKLPREKAALGLSLCVVTDNPSLRVGIFEGIAQGKAFLRKVHPRPDLDDLLARLADVD